MIPRSHRARFSHPHLHEDRQDLALQQRLPDSAMISIGHRSSLRAFHRRELILARDPATGKPGTFLDKPI